jgi:hypothetical protein
MPDRDPNAPDVTADINRMVGVPQFGPAADTVLGPNQPPAQPGAAPLDIDAEQNAIKRQILALTKQYIGALPGDVAARGAAGGYHAQTADAYRRLANEPIPDMKPPQPKPLPEAPKAKYRDPIEAVGNPLAGLALIAGLFTRNSGTATLKAASAAMQAQQKGDQQAYENARTNFKDSLDVTIKQNEQERQQYLDVWNNNKLLWDAKVARINALATANQNSALAAAARGGKADEIGKIIGGLEKANTVLQSLKPAFEGDAEKQIWYESDRQANQEASARGLTGVEKADFVAKRRMEIAEPQLKTLTQAEAKPGAHVPAAEQTFEAYKHKAREILGPNASETDVVLKAKELEAEVKDTAKATDEERKARLKEEAEKKKAYAQWSRPAQLVFEGFGVKDDVQNMPSKVSALDNQKLVAAKRTMESTNAAAQFFAQNPKAIGMAATLFNKFRGSMFASPRWDKYDPNNPAQMNAEINAIGDKLVKDSIANTKIPGYGYLKQSDASLAAEGLKLLMAAALEDASASGARGGSLGLDRIMLQNVYNTSTDPTTMLKFLQRRAEDAQNLWRQYDQRIDFGDPERAPKSMYMEILNDEDFGKLIRRSMGLRPGTEGAGGLPSGGMTDEELRRILQ